MPFQQGSNLYGVGVGSKPESVEVPFISDRAPTIYDIGGGFFPIGKRWIDSQSNTEYVLTSLSTVLGTITGVWTLLGTDSGALNTLSDDASETVTPVAGNIQLAGTANQIATTAGIGEIIFSLIGPFEPSTFTEHSVLLGEGTDPIGTVGPGVTSGIPLIAQGVTADPIFGTAVVAGGGTGAVTLTTHGVVLGQDTAAVHVTAAGTTGQVLIGSTGADPAFGALGVNSGLTVHGVLLGENTGAIVATAAGTNGQVLLGSTGADPVFGTLSSTTGVAFTLGAGTLAVNVKQAGFAINAASTGVALVPQNAYTVTQAGQTSFSLPATAAVGDRIVIASATGNTAGWIITQGASQVIWAGASQTTIGATGTLAGAIHTSVEIMCVIANVEYIIMGGTGLTGLTFV